MSQQLFVASTLMHVIYWGPPTESFSAVTKNGPKDYSVENKVLNAH